MVCVAGGSEHPQFLPTPCEECSTLFSRSTPPEAACSFPLVCFIFFRRHRRCWSCPKLLHAAAAASAAVCFSPPFCLFSASVVRAPFVAACARHGFLQFRYLPIGFGGYETRNGLPHTAYIDAARRQLEILETCPMDKAGR